MYYWDNISPFSWSMSSFRKCAFSHMWILSKCMGNNQPELGFRFALIAIIMRNGYTFQHVRNRNMLNTYTYHHLWQSQGYDLNGNTYKNVMHNANSYVQIHLNYFSLLVSCSYKLDKKEICGFLQRVSVSEDSFPQIVYEGPTSFIMIHLIRPFYIQGAHLWWIVNIPFILVWIVECCLEVLEHVVLQS